MNQTINSLPTIYGVDRFGISGFGFLEVFTSLTSHLPTLRNLKGFVTNLSATPPDLAVEPSSQIYHVDLHGFSGFQDFAYGDSYTPVHFKRDFNPCTHFLDLTVTRVHLPSQTDPKALALVVWIPLSLWPYTTPVAVFHTAIPP
jgi:hypothetical protein